jgi:hypothetical protein
VDIDAVLSHRPATRRGQPVVLLAAAEGRRMARNPLLLAAVAVGLLFCLPWLDGEPHQDWSTENYSLIALFGLPVYFAAFVLGNLAALRERPSTTAEMFSTVPTDYAHRTRAILLAGIAPIAASALVIAAFELLVLRAGGITADGTKLRPTPFELALVPAITASSFAAGVAVARTIRSRVIGVILGTILSPVVFIYWAFSWFPAYFLAPYTSGLRHTSVGLIIREPDRVAWHVAYLLGVAALFAGYALRRSGKDPQVRHLLVIGGLLVVAGLVGQMVVHGGPFPWGGDVGAE